MNQTGPTNSPRYIILGLLVASALACQALVSPFAPPTPTHAPTPTLDLRPLHFENQWFAFDYPGGLQLHQAGSAAFHWYPNLDLGGELMVGLCDPRLSLSQSCYRSIRIMRLSLPSGTNLDQLMAEAYAQPGVNHPFPLADGVLQLNGPIDIDGRAAMQRSYRIHSGPAPYELRDIWIPVNNDVYLVCILTQWTNADDLAFEAAADAMLGSLVIK